jgi:HEAT repeat protein
MYSAQALSALRKDARIALPALVKVAKSPSEGTLVRRSAIGAIAALGLGDEKAIQTLKELSSSDDTSIRAAAKKGLSFIDRQQKELSK